MSETRKTATFCGMALALVAVTWATTPRLRTPDVLVDRGQLFFPQFTDPNPAASLEVVQFEERNAAIKPLKVQNRNGRWTIPSQFDYPTDAKDRLAKTAAAIIAMRRDDVASDTLADHERMAVVDPLDNNVPTLAGRGTRVTVRGAREELLADIILGNPVASRPGYRYVRQPGQRRVFVSNVGDLTVSTAFGDWIERDLLQMTAQDIDAINIRNYALDRSTGQVVPGDTLLLQRMGDQWSLYGLRPGEQLDLGALDVVIRSLVNLTISGVLPKPPGISATLREAVGSATLTEADIADLRGKGFYLTPTGQLVSNRGEVVIRTTSGVFYTLRFGDIAPGGADAPSAAPAADGSAPPAANENRYMFIMVDSNPQMAKTPSLAADGAEKTRLLRARFAPWYYVISANSFSAVQASRADLVKPRS
jgi:hypothetical protein